MARSTRSRTRERESSEQPENREQNENREVKKAKVETNESKTVESTEPHKKQYWLMKAEPETRIVKGQDVKFSIDDLKAESPASWDGVRNYEARNNMMKMREGDIALFYHSNCKEPGVVGEMRVCKEAYVDYSAFDPKHPYYDPKSDKEKPRWFMVSVEFLEKYKRIVPLEELKSYKDTDLKDMALLKRMRLSVTPVSEKEFKFIKNLASSET